MQKSLHISPEKCTGCLQCEMACSFENYATYAPARSRIKVFDFHHTGRKVPTPAPSATRRGACMRARWRRSPSTPPPGQGRQRDHLRRLQGVHHRLPVRDDQLCAGDRQGAEVRPVRRRAGLRRKPARPAPSPTSTPTGPAWTRWRRGPTSSAINPLRHKESHVLGWKDSPRRPRRGHRHLGAAEHDLGAPVHRLARPGHQIPRRGRWTPGRSPVAGEQDRLGHRPADRHDGLHRQPLHRGHQGAADRRHRLLEFRAATGAPGEDGRLGHGHLRGRSPNPCTSHPRTTWPSCATPRPVGQDGLGDRGDAEEATAGSAGPGVQHRPAPARTWCSTRRSTTCTAPPGARASAR